MKVYLPKHSSPTTRVSLLSLALTALLALPGSAATTQLVLSRDAAPQSGVKGVVDLAVDPGFEDARVTVTLDGDKLAEGLRSPWHVTVDFGPTVVQHKITVTAWTSGHKRAQWHELINEGQLPLTVKVRPVDLEQRIFEATVTAPQDDPIQSVKYWNNGAAIGTLTAPPYRFTIPAEDFRQQFVQVTAKTKSGEEAADFWSATGDVDAATLEVRTVPLYVSVVDGSGSAHDDVDRSLFRITDNGAEGKILEFSKAFDQPISIALVLDASASMNESMPDATGAALAFVQHTLKKGDRCAILSVRDVPRREVPLTGALTQIAAAIKGIHAGGRTALYDAIDTAIRELKDEKNRKAIVVLTDGGDTSSFDSFDDIDRSTKAAGIPLYIIAYDSGDPAEPRDVDRMNYLAGETGGFLVTASARDLRQKYTAIEKDLRAQYAILYQISDFARHNQWRRVRVLLKSPTLTARTIRGYFAP